MSRVQLLLFMGTGLFLANATLAQPPEFRERGADGPRRGFPRNPIMRALDADGDGVISSAEIDQSVSALKSLDKNGDGQLEGEEMRPDFGRRVQRGPNAADVERRPARDGRPPAAEGERGPRRGPGPPDAEGRRFGRRGGPGGFGPPPGFGPPSPEAFVERAMQFDADGDNQLSRSELMKMAESLPRRGGGPRPERTRPASED